MTTAPPRHTLPALRTVAAAVYLSPLREGGSLPAVIEADDGAKYVLKFHGAGQGPKVLLAELVAGELARALGLCVPELVLVDVTPAFGQAEPDPEIHDLIRASHGLNLGMAYLPGALAFDCAARPRVPGDLASRIVAFDAYAMNMDRTARNPNMLWHEQQLWLIDHGAAFYWQHDWDGTTERASHPFPLVRDHALLRWADRLEQAVAELRAAFDDSLIERVLQLVPPEWFLGPFEPGDVETRRRAYVAYLRARRDAASSFLEEALRARTQRI